MGDAAVHQGRDLARNIQQPVLGALLGGVLDREAVHQEQRAGHQDRDAQTQHRQEHAPAVLIDGLFVFHPLHHPAVRAMPPASILQLFLILAHKAFSDNISRRPRHSANGDDA